MAIFIGHSTALRCFRRLPKTAHLQISQAAPRNREIPSRSDAALALQHLSDAMPNTLATPLDIVVANEASRSRYRLLTNHIWQLPERNGCFLAFEEGVYLSSPELCFIQLGRECSEIELAKIGFELCGSYRIDRSETVGFRNAEPLTSVNRIGKLLEKMPGKVPRTAKSALRYVRDGSASPMETCLALMLGLPARLGGYGLGMPEMNAEVSISAKRTQQVTHRTYHCDLFWPESRVVAEYNSREFHMSEAAAERDASRINNLQAAGINALAVTRAHVADPEKLDAVAHSLARMMGKRIRTNYADIAQRRVELRKQLFAKDPWS